MSWKDGKRAQALSKSEHYYTPKEIQIAWTETLKGVHGDVLIYSMFYEANKPHIQMNNIDANAAVFREGKRDLVDQVLRLANEAMS